MTNQPKEVRRSILRKVIRAELMANWKLRLTLTCGHTVIVTRFQAGEYARCTECGKTKNLVYEDDM